MLEGTEVQFEPPHREAVEPAGAVCVWLDRDRDAASSITLTEPVAVLSDPQVMEWLCVFEVPPVVFDALILTRRLSAELKRVQLPVGAVSNRAYAPFGIVVGSWVLLFHR